MGGASKIMTFEFILNEIVLFEQSLILSVENLCP